MTGYHIGATDGEMGYVQGMLVDEKSWAIRYLIVNTSNWWIGHQVLLAPAWITKVNWLERSVTADLTREAIQKSPPYDPAHMPDPSLEIRIHEHHGRRGYRQAETALKTSAVREFPDVCSQR